MAAMTTPTPTPAPALAEGGFPSFTTSTNLGPLTTTLSFASNCFSNFYDMNIEGLGPTGEFKTQGTFPEIPLQVDLSS